MKAKHRFYIAIVILGLLMTGPFCVTSLLVWLDMKDAERDMLTQLLLQRLPVGTIMTVFGFAVGVLVLHYLFKQYVEGLLRMAETLRLMLGANRNFRVKPEGPPEVQQLANAANDLAQQRDLLMDDVDAQIARAKASLRLAELHGIDGAARILNRESGLLALGGASDMRALRAAGADFALHHFAYWAVRHAGSMVAAMGGLDAIAFTGAIGEHDAAMRAAIVQGLGFLGAALDPDANAAHAKDLTAPGARVAIWTVPAEEERQIAREAMGLIARKESA